MIRKRDSVPQTVPRNYAISLRLRFWHATDQFEICGTCSAIASVEQEVRELIACVTCRHNEP